MNAGRRRYSRSPWERLIHALPLRRLAASLAALIGVAVPLIAHESLPTEPINVVADDHAEARFGEDSNGVVARAANIDWLEGEFLKALGPAPSNGTQIRFLNDGEPSLAATAAQTLYRVEVAADDAPAPPHDHVPTKDIAQAQPADEITTAEDSPPDVALPADCDSNHQVWMISSRQAGACGNRESATSRLRYSRYERGRGWVSASLEEFLANDDATMATAFYVHGHRVDPSYAKEGGWDAYRAFIKMTAIPTRFVIWSWPTTPAGRPLEDFRIKACESEVHSYYLAWIVDRIQPQTPVHLVGYSYGARVITGSLHLLGGGTLRGYVLDDRAYPNREPLRASLLAAALDNDWLLPGRRHGQALTQVDRMFITKNPLDPVLNFYGVVLHDRSATPLGTTGVAGMNRLGDERVKVQQVNVSRSVGKHHAVDRYWSSRTVTGMLRGMADETPEAGASVAGATGAGADQAIDSVGTANVGTAAVAKSLQATPVVAASTGN